MKFTAHDVPLWRRELVGWHDQHGADWYHVMIELGRQQIRPAGPPALIGAWLSGRESERLTQASLWFIDTDTCDLVSGAHASMPPFAPVQNDLPSKYGFVLFANPIAIRDPVEETGIRETLKDLSIFDNPDQANVIEQVNRIAAVSGEHPGSIICAMAAVASDGDPRREQEIRTSLGKICNVNLYDIHAKLLTQKINIVGVSWSPAPVSNDPRFPNGGTWMSFYSESSLERIIDDPNLLARCRHLIPPLMVDNEAVVPWYPGDGDREQFVLPMDTSTTYGWARLVFATFRLGAQRGLCEQVPQRTDRPERRRTDRAGLPARDVTVVRLRSHDRTSAAAGTGIRHGHRYPVRGHWRSQWYPSAEDHRPIWIDQHIRGPEGTELRGSERVVVL